MKYKTIKDAVEYVLSYEQSSRNNDHILWWKVMEIVCKDSEETFSITRKCFIEDAPDYESVRRMRQKFQEEGLYPASEEVVRARAEKEQKFRKEMRGSTLDLFEKDDDK